MDQQLTDDLWCGPPGLGDSASALRGTIDGVLARPGAIDRVAFARFLGQQRQVGLVHGDRPLCRHLAPLVVTAQRFNEIAVASARVAAAVGKVATRALSDPQMAAALGLSAAELALASIEPGYSQALAVGCLHVLLGDRDFQFVGLNADSPVGLANPMLLRETQMALPALAPFLARNNIRKPTPHVALLKALEDISASWRKNAALPAADSLVIAMVDWAQGDAAAEIQLLSSVFRSAGHRPLFVDPGELHYDGQHLTARGQAIDLVYRRVTTHKLVERGGIDHPLLRAYRDGAVCVANSFRATLLNKKAAFAVLSEPGLRGLFSAEERQAIDAHVPWTRRVRPGQTSWRDGEFDLATLLENQRENLVLKSNDDSGGKRALLGWRTDPVVWRDAIAAGLTSQSLMIAQERQITRPLTLPTCRDGRVTPERVYADLCSLLFAGQVEGAIVRVSSSPMTNVSAGGGVTSLLIVEDGERDQTRPADLRRIGDQSEVADALAIGRGKLVHQRAFPD